MALTAALLWFLLGTTLVQYAVAVLLLCPTVYLGTLWLTAPTLLDELMELFGQALGRGGAGE